MDYSKISNFLDKFKKIIFKDEELRAVVLNSIFNETKRVVNNDKIKIKNGIVYIKESPIFLNEIMIKKGKILSNIKNILPNSNIFDIK